MAAINAAWEILRDPQTRARHDRARRWLPDAERPPPTLERASPARAPARDRGPADRAADRSRGGPSHRADVRPRPGCPPPRPPETGAVRLDSGRSNQGGGYDPAQMGAPDGLGAAGPPPGDPSGSVLNFGRYAGWSLGEIARRDLDYIEWLDRMPIGRPYREEIDGILRNGRRGARAPRREAQERRGLFRRADQARRAARRAAAHHSARVCRMLMLWTIPRPTARLISDAPPCETNGSGMPVIGMIPTTIPRLTIELEQDHRREAATRTSSRTGPSTASRRRAAARAAPRTGRAGPARR